MLCFGLVPLFCRGVPLEHANFVRVHGALCLQARSVGCPYSKLFPSLLYRFRVSCTQRQKSEHFLFLHPLKLRTMQSPRNTAVSRTAAVDPHCSRFARSLAGRLRLKNRPERRAPAGLPLVLPTGRPAGAPLSQLASSSCLSPERTFSSRNASR